MGRQMANQAVQCSHCHGSGFVKARQGQIFESSVLPLVSNRKPFEREPVPEMVGVLSPGETRRSTLYHRWSAQDVWASLSIAVVSGSFAGLAAIPICVAARAKWHWPFIVWTGVAAIMWGLKAFDFFTDDKAVVSSQEQERVPEPTPIVHNPPAADIVINSGMGQKRSRLKAPKADHTGLYRYADALARGTAEISIDGGKHLPGAKGYHYTPREFDTWRSTALAGDIIEEDPHKSKGYRLTEDGRRALAQVAKQRLGEWG